MLKCFLVQVGVVIQINHVVEADESKYFMLANYSTDYNKIQYNRKVFIATYTQFTIHCRINTYMTKGIRRKSRRVPLRNFVYYHMFLYMASKLLSTCVSRLSMDEQLTIINSVLTSRIRIYSDCYNYGMVRQTLGYAYMILENCIFKWWPS